VPEDTLTAPLRLICGACPGWFEVRSLQFRKPWIN
jgi:hypothetical protein